MITTKLTFLSVILTLLNLQCEQEKIRIFNVEEVFSSIRNKESSIEELPFPITNCLYLDTSFLQAIQLLDTQNFHVDEIRIEKYVFRQDLREEIHLNGNYRSIENIILSPDPNLKKKWREKFGYNFGSPNLNNNIIVNEQKAFVQFSSEYSSSGFVLEFSEPYKLSVLIVYIIID